MNRFSKEFMIGAATAGHQVEGNNIHSDSWALEQLPHSIYVAMQTLRDPKYQEKRQLRSGSKVSIIKLAVRDFS